MYFTKVNDNTGMRTSLKFAWFKLNSEQLGHTWKSLVKIVDPHKWWRQVHCALWLKGNLTVFIAELCFLNYGNKSKNCKKQRIVSHSLECSFQSRRRLIGHGNFPVRKRKPMYRQAEHCKMLLDLPHTSVTSLCFLMQEVFLQLHKVEKYCKISKGLWFPLIRKTKGISSALW